MVFCYQIALWASGECEIVGRTRSLSVQHCWCMQLIFSSSSVRRNGGRVEAADAVYLQVFSKVCWGIRYWRLKQSGPRLIEVFAVILPVEATTPLVDAPADIGSKHGVCDAWRDGCHYDHSAGHGYKHATVGVYLVVGLPSPSRGGESGRSGALSTVVHGTDSHWRDPWPNIALRSVPHAWHPCPGRSDVFAAQCCPVFLGNS